MTQEQKIVCPWCDTEIIWDPEIGPEDACPHCFNDLGDYRSVNFGLDADDTVPDGSVPDDVGRVPAVAAEGAVEEDWPEDEGYVDTYSEKVQQCIDTQEEAPECTNCRELMLLAGSRAMEGLIPVQPKPLGRNFLKPSAVVQVFVCPSCFKTDTFLSEQDRLDMVQAFTENE